MSPQIWNFSLFTCSYGQIPYVFCFYIRVWEGFSRRLLDTCSVVQTKGEGYIHDASALLCEEGDQVVWEVQEGVSVGGVGRLQSTSLVGCQLGAGLCFWRLPEFLLLSARCPLLQECHVKSLSCFRSFPPPFLSHLPDSSCWVLSVLKTSLDQKCPLG